MPLRFSRRFNILPGLRINVSKSGISESIGTKGAWFTVGPRGTRTTVGLPRTGLSYSEQSRTRIGAGVIIGTIIVLIILAFVFAA